METETAFSAANTLHIQLYKLIRNDHITQLSFNFCPLVQAVGCDR
jgi:hypothetical protein